MTPPPSYPAANTPTLRISRTSAREIAGAYPGWNRQGTISNDPDDPKQAIVETFVPEAWAKNAIHLKFRVWKSRSVAEDVRKALKSSNCPILVSLNEREHWELGTVEYGMVQNDLYWQSRKFGPVQGTAIRTAGVLAVHTTLPSYWGSPVMSRMQVTIPGHKLDPRLAEALSSSGASAPVEYDKASSTWISSARK